VVASLLAAAVLALAGVQTRTTLHVFTPWAGSIPAAGVTIDKTLRGSCDHGSEVLIRFDAWHCVVGGGRVYDPCFANTRAEVGAHVLCTASPWEDATAIELAKPLPLGLSNPQGNPERFPPWAGLRANYACAGSGLLLGLPARGTTWTQAYAATVTTRRPTRRALRSVWW